MIAPRLAAIGDIHLAAAMATAQEPGEKQLPAPYRSSGHGAALAGRIVGDHALVPLELLPGDIALVLILEQHVPFRQWAPQAAPDTLAAILDADLARRAAKSIGAGIDWVGQDIVHGIVERQFPDNTAPRRRAHGELNGQCDALVSQPDVNLTHALELGELGEDQLQGLLNPLVGILLDPVAPDFT